MTVPAGAARPPPSSSRPSPTSSPSPTRWSATGTTPSTSRRRRARRTPTPSPRRRWTRRSREQDEDTGEQEAVLLRGTGVRGRLRPGPLQRRRVRHAGPPGQRGGAGLPRHPRPPRARPGAVAAPEAAGPADHRHSRKKPDDEADLLELPAERRPVVSHKELMELRKQLNTMVGAYVHQSGKPHGVIHTELRRVCGGPPSAEATGRPAAPADRQGAGVGHAHAVTPGAVPERIFGGVGRA
ncbi:hypothetical protein LSPH24S_00372 [Lysinibacillus sphaericus]